MITPTTKLPLIEIRSFHSRDNVITIDRSSKTCTCEAFLYSRTRECEHLHELGIYTKRAFTPSAYPTFSQALSGLVKSIRMRHVDDAIYWLVYLDQVAKENQQASVSMRFRIARRILIASAEDGHSVSTMESVASRFKFLCRLDCPLSDLALEIVRICKLPNWWDDATNGHDYIYCSLVGVRQQVLYSATKDVYQAKAQLRIAIENSDKATAIGTLCQLGHLGLSAANQAEYLALLAQTTEHRLALRALKVHLNARAALSSDNNFTSQAAWMLAGGESLIAESLAAASLDEVQELMTKAAQRREAPEPIATYYCDGIHCAGNDRRYAGMLPEMYAVCCAFNKYGNIDPKNAWLPDFYSTDGLELVS